jgi:hypothetical protein
MKSAAKKIRWVALAAILPLVTLPTAACDDEDNDAPDPGTAQLRVVHLSPDAPAVDVWVDGEARAVESLAFGEGTDYLTLDVASYDFAVSAAGTSAAESVLDIDAVSLSKDERYTVVAFDSLSSIQALLLEEDTMGVGSGDIRIRAIHTAVGVGEVDIWNIPESGDPAPLYEDVGFGVAGAYLDLPAAAYTIGFDVDNDASPDLVFDIPALPAGTVANVFAVASDSGEVYLHAQLQDGSLVRIDPREEESPTSQIRVLHLSRDAGAVDVWAGTDTRAVEDLGFPEGTDYLTLDEGTYTFNITGAGGDPTSPVLSIEGVELQADKTYTAVAFNDAASIQALALEDDYAGLASGDIRVRAIHAAPGVGTVDIWNISDPLNPAPLYQGVGFGDAGDYLDIPAGTYTLGVDVNADAEPDLAFALPTLAEGTVASLFAVQDANDDVFLLAQFADGSTARIDASDPPTYLRVLHLSRDTPAVDVYAFDTTLAVSGLDFPVSTGYLALDPGTYTFNVTAAGGDPASPALSIQDIDLMSGSFYTAVAFDDLSSIQALPLEDDYEDVASGEIRVRAVHTAVGVGQVDIWEVSDSQNPLALYTDVDFGVAGAYLDLPAAAYTLGFDLDNDASADVTFDIPSLPAGTVANIFAVTDSNDAVFLLAQLADGSTVRIDAN